MSVNKVILVGNIGKDPEIRTAGEIKVANVSLATTEKYKDKKGETVNKTEWHNLVFFGKLAEIVEKWVKKGSMIYVCGKLEHNSYEKDGVKKYFTQVNCNEMKMLGGKQDSSYSNSSNDTPSEPQNDDLPF